MPRGDVVVDKWLEEVVDDPLMSREELAESLGFRIVSCPWVGLGGTWVFCSGFVVSYPPQDELALGV
ncbi:proline-rich receptor-like protein kinase PERK9 [Iris pallida]|nr:proline-rich receptor-like protein kinase PERK9 [Iris pallida]